VEEGVEVKEEAEQIEEMHKEGDSVRVPHKGKMVRGKIVRADRGGNNKARQHGGGYVVNVGEYGSITVPHHKVVREEAEQIDEAGERRLKRLMGASYKAYIKRDDKKHSKMANLAGKLTHKIERNQARRAGASPEVAGQANPLDMKKGRVTRASNKRYSKKVAAVRKFRNRASTMRAAATAAMSEELVGKQHKLDVNKNKRLDSQDFAALRAKKKAVKESQETPKIAAGKKRLAAAILAQKKEDEQKKKRENDFVRKFSAFAKRMNRSTGYKPTTMQKENYPEFSGGIPLMVPNPTDNIADQSDKGKKKIIRKNTK